jgi:adenylate kinase family enzyme
MKSSLPKKTMIFGRPGSGKSTFSYELHKILNVPLYHLDKYFFVSNWVPRDFQEFLTIQQSNVNERAWIIDGNSTKSLEMRYAKADLVLYFNYSRFICLWRILKRLRYKSPKIDDRANGCKERVPLGLIGYMWTFQNRVDMQLNLFKIKYPNTRFIEIKNDKELRDLRKSFNENSSYAK